jgi:hypothetical protein
LAACAIQNLGEPKRKPEVTLDDEETRLHGSRAREQS